MRQTRAFGCYEFPRLPNDGRFQIVLIEMEVIVFSLRDRGRDAYRLSLRHGWWRLLLIRRERLEDI